MRNLIRQRLSFGRRTVCALILGVILATPLVVIADPAIDKINTRITNLFLQLKQEQQKTAELQSTVATLTAQMAGLVSENAEMAQNIADLTAAVTDLQNSQTEAGLCPVGQTPICCPTDTTLCGNDGCVDILTDPTHCGGCGNVCGTGTCVNGACTVCGNGIVEPGEECDPGAGTAATNGCSSDCTLNVCEDEVVFAVGVFGTTTCANNCQSVGKTCVGIGTDDNASNGQYYECGSSQSGVGQTLTQGSCTTVLGGQGCSEYTQCLCDDPTCSICGNGLLEDGEACDDGNTEDNDGCSADCLVGQCLDEVVFAVGVFGTTTCANNCQSVGKTCIGIGTDDNASNGQYYECGSSQSGVGQTLTQGSCNTVLGGQGCSEYTQCLCDNPTCSTCGNGLVEQGEVCDDGNTAAGDGCNTDCTALECIEDVVFAVGVFGTTTCANNCQSVGKICVGIGTDDNASNDFYYECGSSQSGIGQTLTFGNCGTVLGGQGCSEYTQCACLPASCL